MKIAISTNGESKESVLDKRFGRCEYFQIYDTDTKETKSIRNNGENSAGGAGIAAASQIIEEEVQVIITGSLGPNAFELVKKAGIEAYSCDALPVLQAIEMFQKKELSTISSQGKAHQGMRN